MTTSGAALDRDQVAAFRRDGFLFPLRVLDADETEALRSEFEDLDRRWRSDPTLPRPFEDYLRANLGVVSTAAARAARHPAILDRVESLLGPDILCWMAELIVKEAHTEKILTVHQDLTYWGLDHPDDVVTAWVALSEARIANGAMTFVRGSHLLGQVGHHDTFGDDNLLSRGQEIAVDYDPADVVAVELRPGEMSLHHGLMFHGSGPNRTNSRRVALVLRYVSPRVKQTVGPRDFAQVVRGENPTGNLIEVDPPTSDFSPESLALFERITAAQAVALADDAGHELSYTRGDDPSPTVLPPGPAPDVGLPAQPTGTPWPTKDWPEARPDDPDVSRLLDEGFDASEEGMGQQLALLAVRGGRIVAERYGPGADASQRLISWSMAKSVTHALVGIAVGEGRLELDSPAPVPEWHATGDPRSRITLDHLLRMVPGTRFVEDYVDDEVSDCLEMLFGRGAGDMGRFAAELEPTAPPDTVFNYSSGTTNIVSRILADIYGRDDDFERWARRRLFEPLGMDPRLTFDDAGTWVGSSFLHATTRDFARFGLLYLRDGVWEDDRLLPEGWVDYARTPRARAAPGEPAYGAHWWLWGEGRGAFHASGYEAQRLIVDPAADLVVVRLGKTPVELAPTVDAWLRRLIATLA